MTQIQLPSGHSSPQRPLPWVFASPLTHPPFLCLEWLFLILLFWLTSTRSSRLSFCVVYLGPFLLCVILSRNIHVISTVVHACWIVRALTPTLSGSRIQALLAIVLVVHKALQDLRWIQSVNAGSFLVSSPFHMLCCFQQRDILLMRAFGLQEACFKVYLVLEQGLSIGGLSSDPTAAPEHSPSNLPPISKTGPILWISSIWESHWWYRSFYFSSFPLVKSA